jgi:3-oxoadipate enol-lactonase
MRRISTPAGVGARAQPSPTFYKRFDPEECTMSQTDDFDRGLNQRRAVLGDEWVDRSLDNATTFNADYQSLITRFAWNDIWGRPGLDFTTRRLLVLAQTAALARWEEFELHFRSAVRMNIPLEMLKETLMQLAIYSGVPAANTAFKLAQDILRDEGHAPELQPLSAATRPAHLFTFSEPQIHIHVQGQGSPVVLSHALGVDMHMWDGLAATLASKHKVLRYDHRGHGKSAPAGPYTLDDDLVEDAARVIREWGQGPVVWIGLSMGGMVGQGLALKYPELVKGLVLANTTSSYPEAALANWTARIETVNTKGLEAVADGVMERYFNTAYRTEHPSDVAAARRTVVRNDPKAYAAACHAVRGVNYTERLAGIKVPTLVIAGADDQGTPVAMSEAIVQRVPGAELAVIDNASHLSVAEQPARFAELVSRFLERFA